MNILLVILLAVLFVGLVAVPVGIVIGSLGWWREDKGK